MGKSKIDTLSMIVFILCSIFLMLVQFGYISPIGVIVISPLQYVWVFWFSVIAFILTMANLVTRIPRHARWSIGYSGEIVRTVKKADSSKDYFIRGKEHALLKEVLQKNWPFDDKDQGSKWYVVDEQGNDVTSTPLGQVNETVSIVFLKDD